MIQVSGIKLKIGESTERLPAKVESRLRVPKGTIESVRIVKESLDAREKPRLYHVYTLELKSQKPDEWLAEACRREGLKLGFYYSHVREWRHPMAQSFESSLRPDKVGNYGNFWDYPDET